MTQKEALKNLAVGLPHDIRLLLVSNWLEDINWHRENGILMEKHSFIQPKKMAVLEILNYLMREYNFYAPFIKQLKENLEKEGKLEMYELTVKKIVAGESVYLDSHTYDVQDLANYARTNWYQAFSYMYGWGINSKDWNSEGKGEAFAEELYNDVINFSER